MASSECFLCATHVSAPVEAVGGILRAKLSSAPAILNAVVAASCLISVPTMRERNAAATIEASPTVVTHSTADYALRQNVEAVAEIAPKASLNMGIQSQPTARASLNPTYTDKFAGEFNVYGCYHKLYPIADVVTSLSGYFFVDKMHGSTNLYQSIDEGIFTGSYHTDGGSSSRISDDRGTYIHPSAIYTDGNFRYKCEVTRPSVTAKESRLYIRAAAPTFNYSSEVPPEFKITNIKLEDPSGNLIIQYNDISLRGDADYGVPDYVNFTTYGTAPKINNLLQHTWEDGYPIMGEASGYTLNMDFSVKCLDDSFAEGFDEGFEEDSPLYVSDADSDDYLALDGSPLSTQIQNLTLNPTHSLRISAVEICNSGAYDTLMENFVPIYIDVVASGHRLQKCLLPTSMPVWTFDTSIYPTVSSVWVGNDSLYSNQTASGSQALANKLRDPQDFHYITLDSTGPVVDSGKLVLKFGHELPSPLWELRQGAFSFGAHVLGDFDTAARDRVDPIDNFFTIDAVTLRVRAKKAAGSRDYALDVVGYSDDKILNVTPAVGGFLQNQTGSGDIPLSSGFNPVDDFALAGEALSDKDQYFSTSGTNNAGGDHYKLSAPVVSGTTFKWYEIPLKIYEDTGQLGPPTDYSMSSYFENLYLDIFPIPSGAVISSVQLCVQYKPANALQLHTIGYEKIRRISEDRGEGKIYPSARQTSDSIINTGPSYAPISKIEDIPHAFKTPATIKSNYSRRWRGLEGTVEGPFDPDEFGFGFENPLRDYAFTSGFYGFDQDNGLDIIPLVGTLSGTLTTNYSDYRFDNLGWRFKSDNLFEGHAAGYTSDYTTTDWTALSSGADNFQSHELYGQIADAFTSVIRISGHNSYINFGDIDITDEFSLYIRFTPDIHVSGYGLVDTGFDHDFFQSGVIFSKWDAGNDLEFALGYDDKKLCFFVNSSSGTFGKIKDTIDYDQYQYPLPVLITHSNVSGTKMYTDNEISSGTFTTLRASGAGFNIATGDSDFIVGHSFGSGVGMAMFVSEIGISDRANFVHENPDWTNKEVSVQEFLENNRVKFWGDSEVYTDDGYKLWDKVNEDTLQWDLGAFKYCQFGVGFDGWTERSGKDLITFNLSHHGSGYDVATSKTLPSTIDSGVAYHTQMENDFLRFNLTDAADNFYSTDVRITKALPRGYKFSDRALVVETVLENKTFSDIVWSDGKIGPKFIVSLYTRNQEPTTYEKENWGLINRAIHHIPPSSCFIRMDSTFDYNSLVDESESWALFPSEKIIKDFEHRYYSQDIDKMFLQYDLVYPSGSPFESRIDIHSTHIRLEDAFVTGSGTDTEITLSVSGEKRSRENLNLFAMPPVTSSSGSLSLLAEASITPYSGAFNLLTSGILRERGWMWLHTVNSVTIGTSGHGGWQSNWPRIVGSHAPGINPLSLYVSGFMRRQEDINLYLSSDQEVNIPSGGDLLALNMFGGKGNFAYMPAFLHSSSYSNSRSESSGKLGLHAYGTTALSGDYADGFFNLFTLAPNTPSGNINLMLYGDAPFVADVDSQATGGLNLYTSNYGASGDTSLYWSNINFGKDIELDDNVYAALSAGDEIRGVELICYGACNVSGNVKCEEKPLYTHDTTWRPKTCTDGGIFRAIDTYTNLGVSGFNTSVGYSGNYYGIRKYDGLIPGISYDIVVQGQTGSTTHIKLPREWEEWEYGSTEDINFSGVKLIGDYPLLSGTMPVTSGRNENDEYGKAVAAKNDLMVVGAPRHGYDKYSEDFLEEAGALFVYRRNPLTNSGEKASWDMESKVVIPSGFRSDYFVTKTGTFSVGGLPAIPIRQWHAGQKGRHLGHSIDVAISGNSPSLGEDHKETMVVGAPHSSWDRVFDEIVTSGVQIGIMVFTDEFNYVPDEGRKLKNKITEYNFLYRYYASPEVHLDVKIVVCQPTGIFGNRGPAGGAKLPDFILHEKIGRKYGATDEAVLSGIKEAFHEAFPYDATQVHNNIPPIVGMYADDSRSLGREDLMPAIDQFKDYYRDYSFISGVKDWYGVQDSGHLYEFMPKEASENWFKMTSKIMDTLLDTGRLVSSDGLRFITSGVGIEFANPAASEFNAPASKGGRVYIFEKESGCWNLIQEIESPRAEDEGEFDGQPDDSSGGSGGSSAGGDGGGTDSPEGGLGDDEDEGQEEVLNNNPEPDIFGHSVSISDNAEVITIGSPYAHEDNCLVYEYDDQEKPRLYSHVEKWLNYYNASGKYEDILTQFEINKDSHGADLAAQIAYLDLSTSDKFYIRSDKKYWGDSGGGGGTGGIISEYKKIYSYSYSDIAHTGTWQFIPGHFAPTSRLGFSTTVSEDGDIVAFGAPTDSFNEFDDTNIYHKGYDTWASYVNAGAVRVFESRKYTPHSGVIEFFKFGNLDMNTGDNVDNYDDLKVIFTDDERSFRRTGFSEIEIDRGVGLAFIITPEIDAASDEVIANIKDWLSLGDRTLVLVGNDPVWEKDGRYEESNEILNKILSKLDSKLRFHPARNKFESLPACSEKVCVKHQVPSEIGLGPFAVSGWDISRDMNGWFYPLYLDSGVAFEAGGGSGTHRHYLQDYPSIAFFMPDATPNHGQSADGGYTNFPPPSSLVCLEFEERPNLLPSFVPDGTRGTDIKTPPMFAKGVADIRMYIPGYNVPSPCDKYNSRCELPLKHEGDLRSEWYITCEPKNPIKRNWSWDFGSRPDCDWKSFPVNRPNEEPRPLLVAGEYISRYVIEYPAWEETYEKPVWKQRLVGAGDNKTTYSFADQHIEEVDFIWSEASGNNTSEDIAKFFDPRPVEERDSQIQAKAQLKDSDPPIKKEFVTHSGCILAAEESYFSGTNTSKIVMIAGVTPENEENMTAGFDYNVSFYENLVMKDCATKGSIMQIGGWTGRESFEDAYSDSILKNLFALKGNTVQENWTGSLLSAYNIAWVACPTDLPSSAELSDIKSWLGQGDKTLVITYPDEVRGSAEGDQGWKAPDEEIVRNVFNLCNMLDMSIKPIYLNGQERFATKNADTDVPHELFPELNGDNIIIKGCEENHKVKKFYAGMVAPQLEPKRTANFVPMSIKPSGTKIATFAEDVKDIYYEPASPFWQIKSSIAKIDVPVQGGSGYRMFWDWVSEYPGENKSVKIWFDDAIPDPHPEANFIKLPIRDYDKDDKSYVFSSGTVSSGIHPKALFGRIYDNYLDVKTKPGVSGISIFFDANNLRAGKTSEIIYTPKTLRVFSVSGSLLPINETIHVGPPRWENYIDHYESVVVLHAASSVVVPTQFRPIMTDNTKYCRPHPACDGKGNQLIADGPMVAAEEPEHFSNFLAGQKRSTIVLISDSSLLQGDCPAYRNVNSANVTFIKSLYPQTMDANNDDGGSGGSSLDDGTEIQNKKGGRQFKLTQKLLAPERGSPHKYYSASGLTGLKSSFGGGSGAGPLLEYFTDEESSLNPFDVIREKDPKPPLKPYIQSFAANITAVGAYSRFQMTVDGTEYFDAGPGGGLPKILKDTNHDFLDFEFFPSGYPGDLFGYDISMHSGKLVIGAPFHGFVGSGVVDWDDLASGILPVESGLLVSHNGGAGAAFYFERTGLGSGSQGQYLPWEFKQKIKPEEINVGLDGVAAGAAATALLGSNSYLIDDLTTMAPTTDKFGYAVSLDADFAAIGAPGHSFENLHEHLYDRAVDGIPYSGAFLRKEFDFEFDIPLHNVYDLGTSGMRDTYSGSGEAILNNGAVFTFEHRVTDWGARSKTWTLAEKIVSQGYNARLQKTYSGPSEIPVSGAENDHFGESVSINRARRGDSDYTLVAGSPHHMFATSGTHSTIQPLFGAGAAYTFDAMLREQPPSTGSPYNWIMADVFGDEGNAGEGRVKLSMVQDADGSTIHRSSGMVWSNNQGEIFLEASGYDPSVKGFIEHRSYINLVYGDLKHGTPVANHIPLYLTGEGNLIDSSSGPVSGMVLHMAGPSTAKVYNTMDLYIPAAYVPSGDINLFLHSPPPLADSGQLALYVSGVGWNQEQINLRIRGK
jgi:hypothetical protein